MAHYRTTGPEIWMQTGTVLPICCAFCDLAVHSSALVNNSRPGGKVDAFTCATGTGGTLAGTAKFLKEKSPKVKIILADPPGSVLFSWFKNKKLERTGDGSITEGE